MRGLSGKAKIAAVLGWPVSHSRSPRLHGHWLQRYGIDGAYVPLAVKPEDFPRALRALTLLNFVGCNVTLPHKEAALAACDEVDETALKIGAVNTVVVQDGRLIGSNSDAFGFLENLRDSAAGWRAKAGPALVLGAGGAARAVIQALLSEGAPEILLANRSPDRAHDLAKHFGAKVKVIDWAKRVEAQSEASLLVNSTSLGMTGQPALELSLDRLPASAVVTDLVYSPLETPLLKAARARGLRSVDGLGMLLHQARPGFEAWFGQSPLVDAELRAAVLAG